MLVSGGSDMDATYVSLFEAQGNRELVRLVGKQSNRFDREYVDTRKWKGQKVLITDRRQSPRRLGPHKLRRHLS